MSISLNPIKGGVKNEKVQARVKMEVPVVGENMFPLHSLCAFIGARGSGKTNAAINLVLRYLADKSINTIYIMTPTYESNPELWVMNAKPENVYISTSGIIDSFRDIQAKIRLSAKEWEDDTEYQKVYTRVFHTKRFTMRDQLEVDKRDGKPPKYLPKPSPLIFIDDMMKTDIYSVSNNNPFNNFCILHRHYAKVGATIFMMVQNFKGGLSRIIRQNIQNFFIFSTADMGCIESMYEEFGNVCTFETFVEVFRMATAEVNHFLTVSPFCRDVEKQFRQDFDKFINIPESFRDVTLQIRNKRKRIEQQGKKLGNLIDDTPKKDESNPRSV